MKVILRLRASGLQKSLFNFRERLRGIVGCEIPWVQSTSPQINTSGVELDEELSQSPFVACETPPVQPEALPLLQTNAPTVE